MRDKKGFTLVELLIAMAIIALLIGLTVFGITAALRAARDTQRRNFVKDVQTGIADYQGQTRTLPSIVCVNRSRGSIVIGATSASACAPIAGNTVEIPIPDAFNPTNVTVRNTSGTVSTYSTDSVTMCYKTVNDYSLAVYLENQSWENLTSIDC